MASIVLPKGGGGAAGDFFAWMDSSNTALNVTAKDNPFFTASGTALTFSRNCTVNLTAGMMTYTSANSTTTHTAKFTKNGTAVCTATASGTNATTVRSVKTATVDVLAGDVVQFTAPAGYPHNQMGFGHLTVVE